jgi:prepilin-type processing-associated H-X9-DG protein
MILGTGGTNNNFRWGWGTFILPNLDQGPLYTALNPDGNTFPVASTLYNGEPLLQRPLPVYTCPSNEFIPINPFYTQPNNNTNAANRYAASSYVCNQQVMRYRGKPCSGISDISDGTTNTFLIGERRLRVDPLEDRHTGAIIWGPGGNGDSANTFHCTLPINTPNPCTSAANAAAGDTIRARFAISSAHAGGVQFALCDGSVRFISENISSNPLAAADSASTNGSIPPYTGPGWVYQNLLARNDGETIGEF